ncbi:Coilin [Raphanus sativus]|nr:Coilin [Raphanus sativus]
MLLPLCETQVKSGQPVRTEEEDAWERQFDFKELKEDDFEGLFIPINFVDTFLAAEDSTSMIVGVFVGFEKNQVTHILLPPQWSTDRELHISDIPMDNIHMRGMSLMGFVRT